MVAAGEGVVREDEEQGGKNETFSPAPSSL